MLIMIGISTHSLTKRLTYRALVVTWLYLHFNSQPHEEADMLGVDSYCFVFIFQLTASRRGWLDSSFLGCVSLTDFNSQPHEEADTSNIVLSQIINISTHSLTKRLTHDFQTVHQEHYIFQLTASRRGWLSFSPSEYNSTAFQLTASRRGWRAWSNVLHGSWHISTHSLTKRLTSLRLSCFVLSDISTHSLTKRLTSSKLDNTQSIIFQLTASRRGWQCFQLLHNVQDHFNSQPHEEADRHPWWKPCMDIYFNSQPHEEADLLAIKKYSNYKFQLTASRRGWPPALPQFFLLPQFQLTASRRGWRQF